MVLLQGTLFSCHDFVPILMLRIASEKNSTTSWRIGFVCGRSGFCFLSYPILSRWCRFTVFWTGGFVRERPTSVGTRCRSISGFRFVFYSWHRLVLTRSRSVSKRQETKVANRVRGSDWSAYGGSESHSPHAFAVRLRRNQKEVLTAIPLTCVLSPEAGERLGERCCSKIVAGRNWNDSKGTVLLSWSWAIMNAASRSGM